MSPVLISFLASLGISVWVYTKTQNKTGYGNNKNAYIVAGVAFAISFLVIFTIGHSVFK